MKLKTLYTLSYLQFLTKYKNNIWNIDTLP